MIAWMYLDKKSASIDALKDYSCMEYITENHPDEINRERLKMTSVRTASLSGTIGAKNPHSGETLLAASLDEIDILRERYRRALEYMEWFRPAWTALSEEERFVLTEFYLNEGDAVKNICGRFHIERSSAYNKKNRALERLALLLYGK